MIAFVCGGTGGHVYPAIALAQELEPVPTLFLTSSNRKDLTIVQDNHLKAHPLGLAPRSLWGYARFFFNAFKLLFQTHPRLLISTGGSQTLPVVLAAWLLGIPIFIQEQNLIPGRVNRWLAPLAKRIYLPFDDTQAYFKTPKAIVMGNPVRKTFQSDANFAFLDRLSLPNLPIILCFGGSQGAQFLNTLFQLNYPFFLTHPFVLIHVTGDVFFKTHFPNSTPQTMEDQNGHTKVVIFPYFEKMDALYQRASLVISRSGASTLAELAAFQKPAILVPFPFSKDNHQIANAAYAEKTGLAHCIEEQNLTFQVLQPFFSKVWNSPTTAAPSARQAITRDIILQMELHKW